VRSLVLHFNEICELVNQQKPVLLLFLSETRVTENIEDSEISIVGYVCVRGNSTSRFTGGEVIYIKSNVTFNVVKNVRTSDHNYFLCIKTKKNFVNGYFWVIYHSPSSSDANFVNEMKQWCEHLIDFTTLNLIMGDFNIDVSKTHPTVKNCWSHLHFLA